MPNRRVLMLVLVFLAVLCPERPAQPEDGARVRALTAWGQYAEAEALGRQVVSELERTRGPDDSTTLSAIGSLASALGARGDYVEAEVLSRVVLTRLEDKAAKGSQLDASGRIEVSPTNEFSIIAAIDKLASALRNQGKYSEAEVLSRRALAEQRQAGACPPGAGCQPFAGTIPLSLSTNLAATLALEGQYKEAEQQLRRVLADLPPGDRPAVATGALAFVHLQRAEYLEAESLARQTLVSAERRLGPNHPQTLDSIALLAGVLDAERKYVEAAPLHRRALAGFEREYGAAHPTVARALSAFGLHVLRASGPEQAEAPLERSLAIREQRLRPGHPDIAESL